MKQFVQKFKSLIFLLVSVLFFGNALVGAPHLTSADAGPLSLKTEVKNATDNTTYLPQVNAKVGDEIILSLEVKNTSATETLSGIQAKIQLPEKLEYVPGSAQLAFQNDPLVTLDNSIVTTGAVLPKDFPFYQNAFVWIRAKVKDGATGTLTQTSTITHGTHSVSDSTAKVIIGGNNTPVDPKLVVDVKAFNYGNRATNPEFPDADEWFNTVSAAPGDTLGFYILAFNDHPQGTNSELRDVNIKAMLSQAGTGANARKLVGTASASNHANRSDDVTITTSDDNILDYVNGSGREYWWDSNNDLMSLGIGDTVLSSGVNVGSIIADNDSTSGSVIYFQMRVRDNDTQGTIQLEKHAFVDGHWVQGNHPAQRVKFIIDGPNNFHREVWTGENGQAEITDIPFGSYTAREELPAGFIQEEITPANGQFTLSNTNPVQKVVAQNREVVEEKGNLTIIKFIDADGDGVRDANEGPHAGVTFRITGPNGYDQTRQTDANGRIELTNLALGTYTVTETVPTGYQVTTANPQSITVVANQTATATFGNKPVTTPKGGLNIIKFIDADGDGVRDANEGPHANVTFRITGPNGYDVTRQTNSTGRIELTNLDPGTYVVTETVPTGYQVTTANPQNGVVVANETATVTFGNKEIVQPKGSLRIIKFEDKNGNRTQDAGEPFMADVTFRITGPNGYDVTRSTGNDGIINLTNLMPGNYVVTETVPGGFRVTTDNPQTGVVVTDETTVVRFGNQQIPTEEGKGSLKIIKFEDKDGDGTFDDNEPRMANIEFRITGPNGFNEVKRTDANGDILLENIALGTYVATEVVPSGYRVTTQNPQSGEVTENVLKVLRFGNQKVVVVTPTPTPTPTPSNPAIQLSKFVGNANRNEATDKTVTKAVGGDTANWRVVVKNVGGDVLRALKLNDMLPANVKLTGDIVITRDGQKAKLLDFTREFVLIGDLNPGAEVTVEFATVISHDVACNYELVNKAAAEASNQGKVFSEAKVQIECAVVAPAQKPLVSTGGNDVLLSLVLSGLSMAGYVYNRQRKALANLTARF